MCCLNREDYTVMLPLSLIVVCYAFQGVVYTYWLLVYFFTS